MIKLIFLLAAMGTVYGEICDVFPRVAESETETVTDKVTGREIRFLTNGDYMNCHSYPHNRSWLEDDKYVMIESSRPRPEGTWKAACGEEDPYFRQERQLLAVNIDDGRIYHLATLEMEDTSKYAGHLSMSSQYHADYAPGSNTVIYYDMSGHNLYMLDLTNGKRKRIMHVPDGTIGDPPTISRDGTRAVAYIDYPGPAENKQFFGRTTVMYAFDLNGIELTKSPYIINTFVQQVYKEMRIAPCHTVINPVNPDEVSYCHGFRDRSDGSVLKSRIWYSKIDGSLVKLANITPDGHIFTHEIWGPQGKYIYYVDIVEKGCVRRVEPRTGEVEQVFGDITPRCLHISLSGDENLVVYETQTYDSKGNPLDKYGNHDEWLAVYNVKTGKHTRLARFREGLHHPRHCHPRINLEGTKVVFTTGHGYNSRVAYMEIDNID
ncbi:Oligogalacturonate lyase [Limihaloglobus sulfuriphilus]|uniref:Oligogalacturonate lyase n=1 Tax=Limihaloglobus sulfuriphilus TaxID=1851148 RepID=A0A1Q2ME85_9BACT|nr:oligogalacturonate lyase family protein [Limihaloglobus sulfuriphilus]AQQ70954.1 Oligogalacturonate lyase [Limihaloglobus sulfuriphilus]